MDDQIKQTIDPLLALSPLDGRYHHKTLQLGPFLSEFALHKYRVQVEIEWLKLLASCPEIPELDSFELPLLRHLNHIVRDFDLGEAQKIKNHEKNTKHDVKAVEYYLRNKLSHLPQVCEFIHFACTSEDINNLAYALMLHQVRSLIKVPEILSFLKTMSHQYIKIPMVSRTHGQFASGTTLGKEVLVFANRLQQAWDDFNQVKIYGKINGASGNYNAHLVAYPQVNWLEMSRHLIQDRLGLQMLPVTTQIEPHDYLAKLFHALIRVNTILIDLCRDIWSYISLGYFGLKTVAHEVGSSTMPHKVNPIDFENAEGNLGLSIALLEHMARKLPISRWQRDLTDSTVLRNIGVAFGYSTVAYQSLIQGLQKLQVSPSRLQHDLNLAWPLLAEPVQTIMRKHGIQGGYERLKDLCRGHQHIGKAEMMGFIDSLEELPDSVKQDLKQLTPANYIGMADSWPENFDFSRF